MHTSLGVLAVLLGGCYAALPPPAAPAMSGNGQLIALDVVDVPTIPRMAVGGGVTAPQAGATLMGVSVGEWLAGGGTGLGGFWLWSATVGLALKIGGTAGNDFTANGTTYGGAELALGDVTIPSPGYGYRARSWAASVQLVPRLEYFGVNYTRGSETISADSWDLALAVEAKLCVAFNVAHDDGNGTACAYVAPVIYRDGWMQGASVGVLALF
jgi:hypothetical protein